MQGDVFGCDVVEEVGWLEIAVCFAGLSDKREACWEVFWQIHADEPVVQFERRRPCYIVAC